MSQSSLLGGVRVDAAAPHPGDDKLGPSDSTDSGSDVAGIASAGDDTESVLPVDRGWHASGASDTDRSGTGERASADGTDPVVGADILPDRVVGGMEIGVTGQPAPADGTPRRREDEDKNPDDARRFAREAERQQDA